MSHIFGKRILILVPHPDDEIVMACATLGRAKQAGAELFALYLTDGCIAKKTLWPWERKRHAANVTRRTHEAMHVAQLLGLQQLGGSSRPTRSLWRNLDAVCAAILAATTANAIDQIWAPAFEGAHADHDALNACARKIADETGVPVLEFAAYNFMGGRAHSQTFAEANGTETTLALTPSEQTAKRQALDLYASERKNLRHIDVAQESFRPLPAYDYAKPPHEGTLWYARFHWVPFPHPRIDKTPPDRLYAALAAFVGQKQSIVILP